MPVLPVYDKVIFQLVQDFTRRMLLLVTYFLRNISAKFIKFGLCVSKVQQAKGGICLFGDIKVQNWIVIHCVS